jgi:hypothetical protein
VTCLPSYFDISEIPIADGCEIFKRKYKTKIPTIENISE